MPTLAAVNVEVATATKTAVAAVGPTANVPFESGPLGHRCN